MPLQTFKQRLKTYQFVAWTPSGAFAASTEKHRSRPTFYLARQCLTFLLDNVYGPPVVIILTTSHDTG